MRPYKPDQADRSWKACRGTHTPVLLLHFAATFAFAGGFTRREDPHEVELRYRET